MPHNLAPGHPGPPPPHRPRVPAGAPSCLGYCGGPAGVHPGFRGAAIQDFPQGVCPFPGLSRPPPAAPYLPPPGPELHAEGAGGGRRREEAKQSKERTVPGEEPAPAAALSTPSFPPRKRGDGGGGHERKSRFPSATRRSWTARHEPEETVAAARLPLGQ